VREKVGLVPSEATRAVANLVGCISSWLTLLDLLDCGIATMASTAASASEVEGQIVGLYAAQVNNQYVSAAVACWFLWDHGV
jgi:hypothetical protein